MKKLHKTLALILSLAMVFCLLAGCGKTGADPAATGSASENTSGTNETSSVDSKEPATTNAASGDSVLHVASLDEINDFNPFTNQQTTYLCLINNNCLECLLYIDSNMEYTPALAKDWVISEDGLTYTFNLREGVTFHDGSAFTSEDVKFCIEYTQDEANGCWRSNYFAAIEQIDCPDDYTVVLTLSTAAPALLDSFSALPMISSDQDASSYSTTLNGTGAFKFVSYTANDNITFEKNGDYWDADGVKLDGLVLKFFADQSTAITSLQAGDIELIYSLDPSYADMVTAAGDLKVVTSNTSNSTYLFEIGLHNVEAFQEPDVLKAMFMCLDTQTIADQVFYGYASPSVGVVHAGAKYFKEVYQNGYDVEAAKTLLATTPYADGFEFTMYCMTGTYESIAVIWQQELAKIGITMKIDVQEMSVWLEHYLSRDYEMISNSYSMVGTDPATMMTLIISSLYDYQASPDIIPGLKELIDEAASTADVGKRQELYGEIFELLGEHMPVYTYLSVDNLYAAVGNLENVGFNGEARYVFTHAYFS